MRGAPGRCPGRKLARQSMIGIPSQLSASFRSNHLTLQLVHIAADPVRLLPESSLGPAGERPRFQALRDC